MKDLIKQFGWRLAVALVVVGGFALLLAWYPSQRAGNFVTTQLMGIDAARGQLSQIKSTLGSTASPAKLGLGSPPTLKEYAKSVAEAAQNLPKAELKLPDQASTRFASGRTLNFTKQINALSDSKELKSAYNGVRDAYQASHNYLFYHAQFMASIASVLDYNPTIDFKVFDPTSQDTKDRLERARAGLDKVLAGLKKSASRKFDPTSDAVINSVELLIMERGVLSKNGDVKRWVRVVGDEQRKILANRVRFYDKNTQEMISQIVNLQKALNDIANQWISTRKAG